jgi:hypothetical protein
MEVIGDRGPWNVTFKNRFDEFWGKIIDEIIGVGGIGRGKNSGEFIDEKEKVIKGLLGDDLGMNDL